MNLTKIKTEGKGVKGASMYMPTKKVTILPGAPVQHTTEYDRFKKIVGNRKASEYHTGLLIDSFTAHPELIELRPILVNEHLEVLDGQHRLEALRRLTLPVPYQVISGGTLTTVQILNGTQLSWKLLDFIKSFAAAGNKEYKILLDYQRRYPFSSRFMVSLLSGNKAHTADKLVKSGAFEIRGDMEEANAFLEHYNDVMRKSPMLHANKGESFVIALYHAWETEGYDPDRMLEKLEKHPLAPQGSRVLFLKELEVIYNWNVQSAGYRRFI